jgi:hypothetical protein
MSENPLVEQAKQGDVNAIGSLMNRLLKSQGMLANVERSGDRLEILIESDLRSLDDEMRIPKRPVLVGMIKKWFVTIEVKTVSSLKISWQQAGSEEPAWTEEIFLVEQESQETQGSSVIASTEKAVANVLGNGGLSETKAGLTIPPLPVFPRRAMPEQDIPKQSMPEQYRDRINSLNSDDSATSPDLDAMFGESNVEESNFGETNVAESLQSIASPEYLSSDLENPQSFQQPEVLFLADVAPPEMANVVTAPELDRELERELEQDLEQEVSNSNPEEMSPESNSLSKILFQTPSIPIQFVQYVVVCAVIIFAIRGIHAALGTTKAPKTTSAISTQVK